MKLDKLFEQFLSLFKKDDPTIQETEINDMDNDIEIEVSRAICDGPEENERNLVKLVPFVSSGAVTT